MDSIELPGDPPLTIRLRRNARARRISLRVSRSDGALWMTLPVGAARGQALAFAREKEGWLRDQLRKAGAPIRVAEGVVLPYRGAPHRLELAVGGGGVVRAEAGRLLVPGPAPELAARLRSFLRHDARARLAPACDRHAAALGLGYSRLTLRDTRSRWGSCTEGGRLMFSWRLAMAPPEVLDYVAAHEVAHLAEMNHSPRFWALVERLRPGYRAERAWLRERGPELLSYSFGG